MSYIREIPRDLFNEANLLKCYGRIYINLETADAPGVELVYDDGDRAFEVEQDICGDLTITNVKLMVRGVECKLYRPLNSREEWPLNMRDADYVETPVFDADGSFSAEMLEFLTGAAPS